jgi:2,4-dienoyl-CoA reductase (NADPH2)
VILATGITPRVPPIAGIHNPKVLSYLDVLRDKKAVGKTVAIIGAGGIGFDVAEYLSHSGISNSLAPKKFYAEWGVDTSYAHAGGLGEVEIEASPRQIFLLQRKTAKVGDGLGKTTGWIHRAGLKNRRVQMISGVSYDKIDDAGLHITVDGQPKLIPADNVILCAGQDPRRDLLEALQGAGQSVHLIGGADMAVELDAKRAIDQGARLAAII